MGHLLDTMDMLHRARHVKGNVVLQADLQADLQAHQVAHQVELDPTNIISGRCIFVTLQIFAVQNATILVSKLMADHAKVAIETSGFQMLYKLYQTISPQSSELLLGFCLQAILELEADYVDNVEEAELYLSCFFFSPHVPCVVV